MLGLLATFTYRFLSSAISGTVFLRSDPYVAGFCCGIIGMRDPQVCVTGQTLSTRIHREDGRKATWCRGGRLSCLLFGGPGSRKDKVCACTDHDDANVYPSYNRSDAFVASSCSATRDSTTPLAIWSRLAQGRKIQMWLVTPPSNRRLNRREVSTSA